MQSNILQGDVLDIAKKIDMVDLVFCSPPYEDARTYNMSESFKGQAWVDWAIPRFEACLERCRGLVAWVIEGRTRSYRYSCIPILLMADLHRRGAHIRKPPTYNRGGIPGSGGPDWLRNDYEFIVCATKGGKLPWSDSAVMGKLRKFSIGGGYSNKTKDGRDINESRASYYLSTLNRKNEEGALYKVNPGNVLRYKAGGGKMGSPFAHKNEAPFPEALADFFIRSFCPPRGTVWDCFSGSGTTAAAALKSGRRAIASDIRKSQCSLTAQRRAEVGDEMELGMYDATE